MGLDYFFTTEAKLLLIGVFFLGVVYTLIIVGLIIFERNLLADIVKNYKKRAELWEQK
jgi:hypothetical protein